MTHRLTIFAAAAAAMLLGGCGKKTEAEQVEADRDKVRELKRVDAIKFYRKLATDFPEHEKANEAAEKARALEAEGAKKK